MGITYTPYFHLGKQEDHNDKFRMDVITQNADMIDAALQGLLDADVEQTEKSAKNASSAALNRGTLGYIRKNLLKSIAEGKTASGVTYVVNEDGSITANGTASGGNSTLRINNSLHLEAGRYILSGCPAGGTGTGYRIQMSLLDYTYFTRDTGDHPVLNVTEPTDFIVSIIIGNGTTVSDLTFFPMIRYAEITDDSYEMYRPSVEERLAALEAAINA